MNSVVKGKHVVELGGEAEVGKMGLVCVVGVAQTIFVDTEISVTGIGLVSIHIVVVVSNAGVRPSDEVGVELLIDLVIFVYDEANMC